MFFSYREVRPVLPDEVRAARAANGWSVEELADVLSVSPRQVEAWEAGSEAPSWPEDAWIRWHREMGLRDRAMADAGVGPCAWVREWHARHPAPQRGSHLSDLARPEIARHVRVCPVCGPSLRGIRHFDQPAWLLSHWWRAAERLPFRRRFTTLVLVPGGVVGLLAVASSVAEDGSPGLAVGALACFAGYLAFLVTYRPLRSFAKNRPCLAWQAGFAAVLFAMLAVVGALLESITLTDPWIWIFAAFSALVLGGFMGYSETQERRADELLRKQAGQVLSSMPDAGPAPGST